MKKRARRIRKLETEFNNVAAPLFLLDARRTVQFFNSGCEALTGWSAAEVVGTVCDYASGSDPADIATLTGRLAPPPEVLNGRETTVATEFLRKDGKRNTRMLYFFPLLDEDDRVRSILGIAVGIRDPERAAETSPARQLHAELAALRVMLRQRFGQGSLVGRCPAMQRVLRQIELAATSQAGLCIQGESGTGREHVARSIHLQSEQHHRAFVPLECQQLPASDLKQTLLRLIQAAAEGAAVANVQPGTLYLANVEALPRDLQQLLIDAVEESGTSKAEGRLRLIASTTNAIDELLQGDVLIEKFFYLLTEIRIELPPLSQRGDDIHLLGQAFVEAANREGEKQVGGCSDDVWRRFQQYNWPGQIDELQQVIAEAHVACSGDLIQVKELPFRFRTGLDAQAVGPAMEPQTVPLQELLDQVERDRIREALEQTRYNKTKAATLLDIPRPRLYRRMEALGIEDRES